MNNTLYGNNTFDYHLKLTTCFLAFRYPLYLKTMKHLYYREFHFVKQNIKLSVNQSYQYFWLVFPLKSLRETAP